MILALANRSANSAAAGERSASGCHHLHRLSDYPNQVNNVLCFPFIFRGALDVLGATAINEEMKLAAVRAIAELAHAEQSEVVASAYGDQDLSFGPEYIIPKPFDPRLIVRSPLLRWRKRRWSRAWRRVRLLISTSTSTS